MALKTIIIFCGRCTIYYIEITEYQVPVCWLVSLEAVTCERSEPRICAAASVAKRPREAPRLQGLANMACVAGLYRVRVLKILKL